MNKTHVPRAAFAAILCAIAAAPAQTVSAQVAIDSFDYTVGENVSGQDGGTGWQGAWGNPSGWTSTGGSHVIGSGSLNYAGHHASAGNRAIIDASSGTIATPRVLPAGIDTDAGTLYFSFLTQKTVDTERSMNVSFAVNGNERFAIGQLSNTTAANHTGGNFGIYAHNNMTQTGTFVIHSDAPVAYGLNEVHLVAGRIDFGFDGSNDRVTIYLDPTSGAAESGLTPYIQFSDYELGAIDSFRMFAGGTSGDFTASAGEFDEFRFGSEFSDVSVIPEPSTYAAIFGGLVLGLAMIRRRMR